MDPRLFWDYMPTIILFTNGPNLPGQLYTQQFFPGTDSILTILPDETSSRTQGQPCPKEAALGETRAGNVTLGPVTI